MKDHRRRQTGYAEILLGAALLTLGAIISYVSGTAARQQIIRRAAVVNGTEGFYAGEIALLHAFFNNADVPLPDERITITGFKNRDH